MLHADLYNFRSYLYSRLQRVLNNEKKGDMEKWRWQQRALAALWRQTCRARWSVESAMGKIGHSEANAYAIITLYNQYCTYFRLLYHMTDNRCYSPLHGPLGTDMYPWNTVQASKVIYSAFNARKKGVVDGRNRKQRRTTDVGLN